MGKGVRVRGWGKGREGGTPGGSKAFFPPDLLSVQIGVVLHRTKDPAAFLPIFMLDAISGKSSFPRALNRRHTVFPERLIGFYEAGVPSGRKNCSSVAESCQEGFWAQPAFCFS